MKYEARVCYPNENQIVVEVPAKVVEMFDNGEVYYNGSMFGDPCSLNDEDFIDDAYLFAKKESIENNPEFTLDEDGNYVDSTDDQILYNSDYFYSSFDYDGPYKTKRGTYEMFLGM